MNLQSEWPEKFRYFRELMTCGMNLYSWLYDNQLNLLDSNCPDQNLFHLLFSMNENRVENIRDASDYNRPVAVTNSLGLMWIVDFARDEAGSLTYIYVIGPAFYGEISQTKLHESLQGHNFSVALTSAFLEVLSQLPLLTSVRFLQFGLMLHYTITGEKITTSDIQYISVSTDKKQSVTLVSNDSFVGTWASQQEILRYIQSGNIAYHKQRDHFIANANMGKLSNGDPERQYKNLVIVFTAHCTQAAIQGGLAPSIAYALSDHYIQDAESCHTMSELAEVSHAMEDDFVRRVHRVRTEHGISEQVQHCCDYIQLHVEEKLTVVELAEMVGYTENYLSKKFKQETGQRIHSYILSQKMERAKELLRGSQESVQSIAERLGFATQSHFGEQFKQYTGLSPKMWRDAGGQNSKL